VCKRAAEEIYTISRLTSASVSARNTNLIAERIAGTLPNIARGSHRIYVDSRSIYRLIQPALLIPQHPIRRGYHVINRDETGSADRRRPERRFRSAICQPSTWIASQDERWPRTSSLSSREGLSNTTISQIGRATGTIDLDLDLQSSCDRYRGLTTA
jgi:hypothetical protein